MPRIAPIDPDTASGEIADHLATTRRMFGGTPNLFTTAAHSPTALGAMVSLFAHTGRSTLGHRAGEQIAIAIAQANRCGYCLSAHTAIGTLYGLAPAALDEARHARSADPRTAALMRLAVAVNQARGHIDDATLDAARDAGITDADVVDVVSHVALNVFTNYLNSVAQTPIDFPEVPLEPRAASALGSYETVDAATD